MCRRDPDCYRCMTWRIAAGSVTPCAASRERSRTVLKMGKGRMISLGRGSQRMALFLVVVALVAIIQAIPGSVGAQTLNARSYADEVVAFTRGTFATNGQPSAALGPPSTRTGLNGLLDSVSLGNGGSITVRFTDNYLSGSGNSAPDLYIYENGTIVERYTVEVSADGVNFTGVGTVGNARRTLRLRSTSTPLASRPRPVSITSGLRTSSMMPMEPTLMPERMSTPSRRSTAATTTRRPPSMTPTPPPRIPTWSARPARPASWAMTPTPTRARPPR